MHTYWDYYLMTHQTVSTPFDKALFRGHYGLLRTSEALRLGIHPPGRSTPCAMTVRGLQSLFKADITEGG